MPVKPLGGTFEDIGDAVVKPFVDQVGKALEEGGSTIIHPTPKPVQSQTPQKNPQVQLQEDRNKTASIRQWFSNLNQDLKRIRDERKQKEAQKAQEENKTVEIKQFEIAKKQQKNVALEQATKKTETKGTIGG